MELIERDQHCRQRECVIAKGQRRGWALQGRSQDSQRTRTKWWAGAVERYKIRLEVAETNLAGPSKLF